MLDRDLAELYGVETKKLNRAVKRNIKRFPDDFMFRLTAEENISLRSQNATLNDDNDSLTSQIAISKKDDVFLRSQIGTLKRGQHSKYLPSAFTEQGVAMLSSVLNSNRAVEVNIEIMRTFIRLRQILLEHKDLMKKIEEMEKNYGRQFRIIFEVIREMRQYPEKPKKQIGFRNDK